MNDDLVQPERGKALNVCRCSCLHAVNTNYVLFGLGFGTHPHRDMEIITYIVNGQLTHQDSTGNKESLGRGSVQFMTAGTGVRHSEQNEHPTEPVRFIQMWITPSKYDLPVNYGSYVGKAIVQDCV